ncbi:hypothetical protein [Pseudomonas sp. Gutcm_11s]|uniref:hypothetical protein n=1 Tax=Pseudomonas sp. Gutcm_11s TaxID=3026088 RepID=UPI002361F38F|nr:hypothetical protein [Pseudomonas sp. Gutcm_11s]MDD0842566.1 hypothetical protein [Pseudomonas sp. Gutcm_11s]
MSLEHPELIVMRERRNVAQAELERYALEQYPIDSEEKSLGLAMRQKAVAAIEEEMRHVALDGKAE